MKVTRGDVVLLNFPIASGSSAKLRPAVVVQTDRNNQRLSSTILASITSNTSRAHEATQVLIDPASLEGQASGLLTRSVVKCENLATVEVNMIHRRIGQLSSSIMTAVDDALKASLDVS